MYNLNIVAVVSYHLSIQFFPLPVKALYSMLLSIHKPYFYNL